MKELRFLKNSVAGSAAIVAGLVGALMLAPFAQAVSPSKPIYDQQIMGRFAEQTMALQQAGKTVATSELLRQLRKSGQSVALPRALDKPLDKTLPADQLYRQFKRATLVVGGVYSLTDSSQADGASGFVIDGQGIGVTNHHVFAGMLGDGIKMMTVMNDQGKVFPITGILASSEKDDIAIFSFDTGGETVPSFALANEVHVGSSVNVISNPQLHFFFYTRGVVSRHAFSPDPEYIDDPAEILSITADYATGSSGAPVFDDQGNIVGLVSLTYGMYIDPQKYEDQQMVVKQIAPVSRVKALIQ